MSAESHSAPVHGDVVLKLSSAYSEGNGGAADAVCPVGPPSATAVAALAYAGHHRTLTEYSRPISTVLSGTSTAAMSVVLTLPESQMGSPPFVNAIWYPCCTMPLLLPVHTAVVRGAQAMCKKKRGGEEPQRGGRWCIMRDDV